MSERAFDVWVYDQLHPDEKNYGGGKKQPPSHSFLKPLPEHLVGLGPKKIIMKNCSCTITQGREGEKGSWCIDCGRKVLEVEERECQECKHFQTDMRGSFCSKLLMSVYPSMHVTYKIDEGTCFTK